MSMVGNTRRPWWRWYGSLRWWRYWIGCLSWRLRYRSVNDRWVKRWGG